MSNAWLPRREQGGLIVHAHSEPFFNTAPADHAPWVINPCGQTFAFAQCRQHSVTASVSILNKMRCPSAVTRTVVAIVVDSIECQSFPVPVGESPRLKRVKAFSPLLSHTYASASIPVEGLMVRPFTSGYHSSPYRLQRQVRLTNETTRSVFAKRRTARDSAAAGLDVTAYKVLQQSLGTIAAVTPAYKEATRGVCGTLSSYDYIAGECEAGPSLSNGWFWKPVHTVIIPSDHYQNQSAVKP